MPEHDQPGHDQPHPDIVAHVDQAMAQNKHQAQVLWSYYDDLVEAGFDDEQAMELVVAYQSELFENGRRSED